MEQTPFQDFERYLRIKKFHEAAQILAEFCHGLNLVSITEILTAAYVSGFGLKFDSLPGQFKHRQRRIENAVTRLKQPQAASKNLEQRRRHNERLRPRTLRDGKHKQN